MSHRLITSAAGIASSFVMAAAMGQGRDDIGRTFHEQNFPLETVVYRCTCDPYVGLRQASVTMIIGNHRKAQPAYILRTDHGEGGAYVESPPTTRMTLPEIKNIAYEYCYNGIIPKIQTPNIPPLPR